LQRQHELNSLTLPEQPQTTSQLQSQPTQESATSASNITPSINNQQPKSGPGESIEPAEQVENKSVEVKEEAQSTESKNNQQAPDLSFLDEDLNDEEFDKVLKSLSKEGTPAVEGEDKAMDPDELNRLLSSDFTQTYEQDPSNSKKRQLDESDADVSTSDAHNDKIAKND